MSEDRAIDVGALAREITYADPGREQIEEMRTAVLATMAPPRRRSWSHAGWLLGAGLAVAAAATVVVMGRVPAPPRDHGEVVPIGAAEFARSSPVPDEVVRLTDGGLHVAVSPLAAGERFRIVVGDGEVEVRGTQFDVFAHGDHLTRVAVVHGRVEVRSNGAFTVLGAGETWEPPRIAEVIPEQEPRMEPLPVSPPPRAPAASAASRPKRPAPPAAPHAPAPVAGPSEAERAFHRGWEALQGGDPAAAATAFDQVLQIDPASSVAQDAAFWRAVADSRAGRADRARHGFTTFLAEYPASVRSGEAAVLLGGLLLDRGDLDGAEAQFQRGISDPVDRLRTRARAGLDEVARRRSAR